MLQILITLIINYVVHNMYVAQLMGNEYEAQPYLKSCLKVPLKLAISPKISDTIEISYFIKGKMQI